MDILLKHDQLFFQTVKVSEISLMFIGFSFVIPIPALKNQNFSAANIYVFRIRSEYLTV